MERLWLLALLSLASGNLQLLDVSSTKDFSRDVVQKGKVAAPWLLPNVQPSRLVDKSSYLQFFIVYPAGDLRLSVSTIDGNSTEPGLYEKVPEKGDKAQSEIEIQLCADQEEGPDAHFIYLEMNCVHRGTSVMKLTASDVSQPSKSLSWYLSKKCYRGNRGDLRLYIDGELITRYGTVITPWRAPFIRVDQMTNVTIALRTGNQKVEDIVVESALKPILRGRGAHGGLIDEPFTFFLSFECSKDIIAENVTVRIRIPPYDTLAIAYVYDCPLCNAKNHSDHLPAIDIGNEAFKDDIVRHGVPLSPYDSGLPVSSSHYFSIFYVSSPDPLDSSLLHVTSNMRVLDPELVCEPLPSGFKCQLLFRCLSDGTASVAVTLPLRHLHQSIEFLYEKQCKKPKIVVHEEVLTDSTLAVCGMTIILLSIWICACWRGKVAPLSPKSIEMT